MGRRLALRRQTEDLTPAGSASSSSEALSEAAISRAEEIEELELNNLEQDIADEAFRFERDVDVYEESVRAFLDPARSKASPTLSSGHPGTLSTVPGNTREEGDMGALGTRYDELRRVHEREIAVLEMQTERKLRGAAASLAQRRAAARIASEEAMRAAGTDEQEVARILAEVNSSRRPPYMVTCQIMYQFPN